MECPICGTDCKDAVICPNCEWELSAKTANVIIPEPPIGRYEGINGNIEIWSHTLIIRRTSDGNAMERQIAYSDIVEINCIPVSGDEYGYFEIGVEGDEVDFSSKQTGTMRDVVVLRFNAQSESRFIKLYEFLEYISEANTIRISKELSEGKRCPRCSSKNVQHRYMYVPIYVSIKNAYECRLCGFQWDM